MKKSALNKKASKFRVQFVSKMSQSCSKNVVEINLSLLHWVEELPTQNSNKLASAMSFQHCHGTLTTMKNLLVT